MSYKVAIRALEHADIKHIVHYWLHSSAEHLHLMGVDLQKIPHEDALTAMLEEQISTPDHLKRSLAMILLVNGHPCGHCNVDQIQFGHEANMHLHLWSSAHRGQGLGASMVRLALPHFFERLQVHTIWSQPYALNPAPHKTLEAVGFEAVGRITTVPGSLNFEQEVIRYRMTKSRYASLYK
jgi:RimJ/RimL family protein N-acetyltransferase